MNTARRTGLSRNQRPPSLLTRVGNKPVSPRLNPEKPNPLGRKLEHEADDVNRPPESSGDELGDPVEFLRIKPSTKSGTGRRSSARHLDDISDSDTPTRGAIKSTNFGAPDSSKKRKTGTRAVKSKAAEESPETRPKKKWRKETGKGSDDEDEVGQGIDDRPRAKNTPRNRPKFLSVAGDPHKDDLGFTKKSASKTTYGKKASSSQESLARKVKRETPRKAPKIRPVPEALDSPEKLKKLRVSAPPDANLSSPAKDGPLRFKPGSQIEDDEGTSTSQSPVSKPASRLKDSRSAVSKRLGGKKLWEIKKPPPPKLKFMMPADLPELNQEERIGAGSGDSPLTELGSMSDAPTIGVSGGEEEEPETPTASCPWCGEAVDEALLRDFTKGKRLNVRMQNKFCQKHKKETAMETWRERNYPSVQWDSLEHRFADHRDFLLSVVNGDEESHFRSILAEKIETGKAARSLKKEENMNPGYYGPRGFNLMCDFLVQEFGSLLKERAVADRVIAGRGPAAFIQSVLVAELAVRLICEDMDVGVKKARDIMSESKALGEMVHEEV
ncbi:hypothetical protein G7046_g7757 [Stylonectria norvegica]|nr:hypothetical protein G7046_g7757 [Stylonectria norvegica]